MYKSRIIHAKRKATFIFSIIDANKIHYKNHHFFITNTNAQQKGIKMIKKICKIHYWIWISMNNNSKPNIT
jgi:hypothetical protein